MKLIKVGYFCKNKLNTHLDEHFVQSNLRFVYLADYQHRGGVEIIAQTRCYTTNYNKAEQLYRQGRYAEAKRHYAAASACPDKPKRNNIAARISACDNAIREATDQRRRQQEAERNGYIRITNIEFRNIIACDSNTISDYGSTLYASDILYLEPCISYEGLCSTSRSETFDVKIYETRDSTGSPPRAIYSVTKTIYPGNNRTTFFGWGYAPGTYRFEVWHDGNFVYSTNVSLPNKSGNQSAEIKSIWVDHNQMQNGAKGMLIHVKFSAYNMLNRTGSCNAYFYYNDASDTPLRDFNNSYSDTGGNVCAGEKFKPMLESAVYNDFTIFIPYGELHMAGSANLKFFIDIYDKASDEWLCRSDWQYFTYGY